MSGYQALQNELFAMLQSISDEEKIPLKLNLMITKGARPETEEIEKDDEKGVHTVLYYAGRKANDEHSTRGHQVYTYTMAIMLREADVDDARVDELIDLAESLQDLLMREHLASGTWVDTVLDPVYDPARLDLEQKFVSLIVTEYAA